MDQETFSKIDQQNLQADSAFWEIQDSLIKEKNLVLEVGSSKPPPVKKAPEPSKKKFKWAVEGVDSGYKFDPETAVPLKDMKNINWDEGIKGSERSESGSDGVFFVEMKSGGVFVVKGSKSIAEEAFTNLLALKLGVYVPKLRILHCHGTEAIKLMNLIITNDKIGASIFGLTGAQYFLMKELIPAKNLDKFNYSEMREIFGDETSLLSENSKKRLKELAIILALDIITNNGDRLPLVWPNQGNSGNLMMSHTGQFICIENCFNDIKDPEKSEKYKKTIEDLCEKITQNPNKEITEFVHISQKIFSYTDYSFQSQGTIELQRSFYEFLKNSVEIDLEEEMKKWKFVLSGFSTPLNGLDGINIPFVLEFWNIFKKYGKMCQ